MPKPKIKVLIADDIAETRENIKRLLYFEKDITVAGDATNGEEALAQAEKLQPDVILMDINMPVMDGITATEQISIRVPTANIIIMSVQGEQEYLRKAMVAGAREYIVKPFNSMDLAESIRRVYDMAQKRQQSQGVKVITPEKKETHVVTVFSTKGGVGKTTLAANLAVSIAQHSRLKVALVDLDLQFGDIAVITNVIPRRTMSELVQEMGQIDAESLESFLVPHLSGIKILPAPSRPEYAELITAEHVEKIIKLLKKNYDFIIIDTAPVFNEVNLAVLDLSTQILLITALDLPTIKNVKLSLEVLETLHQKGKVKMVLNRSTSETGIKAHDMERTLGFLVASPIPSDGKLVVTSVNKGIPFVQSQPGAKVSQSVEEMAEMVIKNTGTQEELQSGQRRGIMGKIFG